VGGTFASTFMSVPFKYVKKIPAHIKVVLRRDQVNLNGYIDVLVELAQEARVKGLLALEEKVNQIEIDDEFLKFCVMLIIDALEATKVREQIENEINCIEVRHANAWKVYERAEAFAPAFGMLGTLIGLINMLMGLNPDDSSNLGAGMSVALITTFYGSFLANVLFGPIGNKLKAKHEEEMIVKSLIMEGILSIQAGENPKYIRDKLKSYLTTRERDDVSSSNSSDDEESTGKKSKRK
ncbi:MAG TPA: motility protein A, partial [Clostridiales bacterium]|nr:motility protein A [Clostridiales bacterium]